MYHLRWTWSDMDPDSKVQKEKLAVTTYTLARARGVSANGLRSNGQMGGQAHKENTRCIPGPGGRCPHWEGVHDPGPPQPLDATGTCMTLILSVFTPCANRLDGHSASKDCDHWVPTFWRVQLEIHACRSWSLGAHRSGLSALMTHLDSDESISVCFWVWEAQHQMRDRDKLRRPCEMTSFDSIHS